MKKVIVIAIFLIIMFVLGIWSPWLNWRISLGSMLGLGTKTEASGMKVFSLIGEIDVYLDNEYKGSAVPEEGLDVVDISPGSHEVKLVRKSDPEGSYYDFLRKINFENSVDVIISYELGPNQKFSEGHIFYAEKRVTNSNNAFINIISNPDNAKIYIDSNLIGESPVSNVEIDLTSQHEIRLEKEGYDQIEFTILPETQEERDSLKGYNLNLEINMFLIPIKITSTDGSS